MWMAPGDVSKKNTIFVAKQYKNNWIIKCMNKTIKVLLIIILAMIALFFIGAIAFIVYSVYIVS